MMLTVKRAKWAPFLLVLCFLFFFARSMLHATGDSPTSECVGECQDQLTVIQDTCKEKDRYIREIEKTLAIVNANADQLNHEGLTDEEKRDFGEKVFLGEEVVANIQQEVPKVTQGLQRICEFFNQARTKNTEFVGGAFKAVEGLLKRKNDILKGKVDFVKAIVAVCTISKRKAQSCCQDPSQCFFSEEFGALASDLGGLFSIFAQGGALSQDESKNAYRICKALQAKVGVSSAVTTGWSALCVEKAWSCVNFCFLKGEDEGEAKRETEENITSSDDLRREKRSLKSLSNACYQLRRRGTQMAVQGVALGAVAFLQHCQTLKEQEGLLPAGNLGHLTDPSVQYCQEHPSHSFCQTCVSDGGLQVEKSECQDLSFFPPSIRASHSGRSEQQDNFDDLFEKEAEQDSGSQGLASLSQPYINQPVEQTTSHSSQSPRSGGGGGGGLGGLGSSGSGGKGKGNTKKGGKSKKKGYDTDILGRARSRGGGFFAPVPTTSSSGYRSGKSERSRRSSRGQPFDLKRFLPGAKKKNAKSKNKKSPFSRSYNNRRANEIGHKNDSIFVRHSQQMMSFCLKRQLRCFYP